MFTNDLRFVICSGYYVNQDLSKQKSIDLKLQTFLFKDYILWNINILTPSVLFRKSFLEGTVLFNDKISRGQETELFSRLFFNISADSFIILNKPLFLYRQHEITKSEVNKVYVSQFKFSQSYIHLENIKRSLKIKDKELVNHCLQTLLVHFYYSLKNKDYTTSKYIHTNLLPFLKNNYFNFYIEFKILGGLFLLFKTGSYKVYKRWKEIEI